MTTMTEPKPSRSGKTAAKSGQTQVRVVTGTSPRAKAIGNEVIITFNAGDLDPDILLAIKKFTVDPELLAYVNASTKAYQASLFAAFGRKGLFAALDRSNVKNLLRALPAPEEVAEFGTSVIPANTSDLAEVVGPVYTTKSVMKLMHVTRQQIDDRRSRGTILALRTADNQWVYPAFQFKGRHIRPAARALLDVFRPIDPDWWSVATWMRYPNPQWGGQSAADIIVTDDPDLELVLPAAHATAARWAA